MFEAGLAGLMGQAPGSIYPMPQQQQYDAWRAGYGMGYSPPLVEGRHYTTTITDDLVDSPAEPPKAAPPEEEPPSEFKELSNHAFHKLLQEFTDLTQLCVQSIL